MYSHAIMDSKMFQEAERVHRDDTRWQHGARTHTHKLTRAVSARHVTWCDLFTYSEAGAAEVLFTSLIIA